MIKAMRRWRRSLRKSARRRSRGEGLTLCGPADILIVQSFNLSMDQEIISRLTQRMVAERLDALIAISPENVTYVSGFVVPSQALMRWRHAACIVTSDGRISMVAIDMEATTVKAH